MTSHGSTTMYRYGCRCASCKRAMADAAIRRRDRLYLARTETLVVPNLGTRRRIQALVAIGWSLASISRTAGYDRSLAGLLIRRNGPLHHSTVERMMKVYDSLSMRLPPETTTTEKIDASRARTMARRNGWPPPLAWPEGRIDDPNYHPRDWHYQPSARAETFVELAERQASISEVCRLLDVTQEGLERWAERHGHRADFNAMKARETPLIEYRNQFSA